MSAEQSMQLTKEQLATLRHMLGIETPYDKFPKPYRNYAAVNPGDAECKTLEALGAIEFTRTVGSLDYYACTDAGRAAAVRSHRDIRVSRSRRRYAKYLEVSDAIADLTFFDFVTKPEYAEARANA